MKIYRFILTRVCVNVQYVLTVYNNYTWCLWSNVVKFSRRRRRQKSAPNAFGPKSTKRLCRPHVPHDVTSYPTSLAGFDRDLFWCCNYLIIYLYSVCLLYLLELLLEYLLYIINIYNNNNNNNPYFQSSKIVLQNADTSSFLFLRSTYYCYNLNFEIFIVTT